ncbi:MAG: hypothetical protein FWE62_01260 [Firmicutes bacterium]|nr:hypothetical protein [Bacillota bacterium]
MAVITVNGPIDKCALGVTLPHEHLLIDLGFFTQAPPKEGNTPFFDKLSLQNLRFVKKDPYLIRDNAVIDSEGEAVRELLLYRAAGGASVVEVTLDAIGRDPAALRRIGEKSGVNIIMGCGEYVAAAHSKEIGQKTDKQLAAQWIDEIKNGVGDTDVHPGVIGEIGTSAVITENEWKAVRAAGVAAAETGYGVHIHASLYETNGTEIARKLLTYGLAPRKICIDHVDVDIKEDYILGLLELGIIVEFDNFGKEFYISPRGGATLTGRFAYDLERCQAIKKLTDRGYAAQIFITNDICVKQLLATYGGFGYGHILDNIIPMLKDVGVRDADIHKMTVETPADFLDR